MTVRMPSDYYGYTDRIIEVIRRFLVKKFRDYKSNVLDIDEINALSMTQKLYTECNEVIEKKFLDLMMHQFHLVSSSSNKSENSLTDNAIGDSVEELLEMSLMEYDPVDKYVYRHEVERKQQRCAEAVISTEEKGAKNQEIDKQLKYYYFGASSKAVTLTDKTTLSAYESLGVKRVQWITQMDGKECKICHERNGKIYDIDKIPPKPHRGCRCRFKPVG